MREDVRPARAGLSGVGLMSGISVLLSLSSPTPVGEVRTGLNGVHARRLLVRAFMYPTIELKIHASYYL